MKKHAGLLVALVAGISTILTSLLTIETTSTKLIETRFFAYFYTVLDLFGAELLIVAVLVALRRPISWALVRGWGAMIQQVKSGRREETLFAFLFILVLMLFTVGVTGYQTYFYALGKYSRWAVHERSLLRRGADAMLRGDAQRAKFLLGVCNTVYDGCHEALGHVDRRLRGANSVREVEALLPPGSPARPAYWVAAYAYDRRWDLYQESVRRGNREFNSAKALWAQAIGHVQAVQFERAEIIMQQLQKEWPGFADSHTLLQEIRGGRHGPFSEAVPRVSVAKILAMTTEPFVIRELSSRALSPIEQLTVRNRAADREPDEYGFERPNYFEQQATRIAAAAAISEPDEQDEGDDGFNTQAILGVKSDDTPLPRSRLSAPLPSDQDGASFRTSSLDTIELPEAPFALLSTIEPSDIATHERSLQEFASTTVDQAGKHVWQIFRDASAHRSGIHVWLVNAPRESPDPKRLHGREHAIIPPFADFWKSAFVNATVLPLRTLSHWESSQGAPCAGMSAGRTGVNRASIMFIGVKLDGVAEFESETSRREKLLRRCPWPRKEDRKPVTIYATSASAWQDRAMYVAMIESVDRGLVESLIRPNAMVSQSSSAWYHIPLSRVVEFSY